MISTKVVSHYTMCYYLTCKQVNVKISSTYVNLYNTVVSNFQHRDLIF